MTATALIHGATGYIGRLYARRAAAVGLHPVLAGRDATVLDALGEELALPTKAFALVPGPAQVAGVRLRRRRRF